MNSITSIKLEKLCILNTAVSNNRLSDCGHVLPLALFWEVLSNKELCAAIPKYVFMTRAEFECVFRSEVAASFLVIFLEFSVY